MAETIIAPPTAGRVGNLRIMMLALLVVALAVLVFASLAGRNEPVATAGPGQHVDYGVRHLGAGTQVTPQYLDYGIRHLTVGPLDPSRSSDYGIRHLEQ